MPTQLLGPLPGPLLGSSARLHSVEDARRAARWRMPKLIFDYVDGAAGAEQAALRNQQSLDDVQLQPRALVNVDKRDISHSFLGTQWQRPFGIAPMGMCNLTWPDADAMLAAAAVSNGMPVGLSTAASSSIEETWERAGENAWFQLYVGQSIDLGLSLVDRAATAGYTTLILTVDVPQVAPRLRDLRNGFKAPLKIGPRQFLDFALHPEWSIRTLLGGTPELANFRTESGHTAFNREDGRGKITWEFLKQLRDHWKGQLIIKGIMHADDAMQARDLGVDAVYISNHGGRQLDSAPAAITRLPLIRQAVGADCPLLFDSGIRNGESIVKALASGADFVMLGRPYMYGIGAAGADGLQRIIDILSAEISQTMAQIGATGIADLDAGVLPPE